MPDIAGQPSGITFGYTCRNCNRRPRGARQGASSVNDIPGNTPILVGAGQYVERGASAESPSSLAARAAAAALADAGGNALAAAIDTIAVVRFFADSSPLWACPFGRSNNPPQSIARAIGATPRQRIYTEVGGNQPQSRLIEFARDIARGARDVVLFAGAEAIRNQRQAERQGTTLDWNEEFHEPLDDRGFGADLFTAQEIHNGLVMPVLFYALIEQARAHAAGRSTTEQRSRIAALLASFSAVAAANPYAQFPGAQSAAEILAAAPMTHLYTKRMVAQDGVNQAAALLLTSVAKARELGIARERWVFLHGMAEGTEWNLSERPDPGEAPVAGAVLARAFALAGRSVADIGPIDIYSCFACAVSAIATHLGLPDDGSRALTLTGGLPYFGGPGNNYSMHAIAEMVWRLRREPEAFGLVTANGGMLSKHAAGIYSCRPSAVDWTRAQTAVATEAFARRRIAMTPDSGRIVSWTVNWAGSDPVQAVVIGETAAGERFVACTAAGDATTVHAMLERDYTGHGVRVRTASGQTLHFSLA